MVRSKALSTLLIALTFHLATSTSPSSTHPIRNLISFAEPGAQMQLVITHNATGDVFVGARNALYHFNPDLTVRKMVRMGPVEDNPLCYHPDVPCSEKRVRVDNNILILLIAYHLKPQMLLVCGSVYRGACQLRSLEDIEKYSWVGPFNDSVGTFNFHVPSPAFFDVGYRDEMSLFTAANNIQKTIASRLLKEENGQPVFEYSYSLRDHFSSVDMKLKRKSRYVYGFSHKGFSYFVLATVDHKSYVARICNSDKDLVSYIELPIVCAFRGEEYRLATAASIGASTNLSRTIFKLDDEEYLYVVAAKLQGIYVRSSFMCAFPLSVLRTQFDLHYAQCMLGNLTQTQLLPIGGRNNTQCSLVIAVPDSAFCSSSANNFIQAKVELRGISMAIFSGQMITAIAVTSHNQRASAFVGTKSGIVAKINFEGGKMVAYHDIFCPEPCNCDVKCSLAQTATVVPVESSWAFDKTSDYIYFLVGYKVVKFPTTSCSIYATCPECLEDSRGDNLECGWCRNKCAHLGECEEPHLFNRSICSPLIKKVNPVSAPTNGETKLEIYGSNFGSGNDISKNDVFVAGVLCKRLAWRMDMIRCVTDKSLQEISGPVSIGVSDFENKRKYNFSGHVNSDMNFTFLTPRLFGIHPGYGPFSGGTNVTFYGRNLEIGQQRAISVLGRKCSISRLHEHIAWCVLRNTSGQSITNTTGIVIDNFVLEVEQTEGNFTSAENFGVKLSKTYVFRHDPEILQIVKPLSLISGGTNLTIIGVNLDSVLYPEMVIHVKDPITYKYTEFKAEEPCALDSEFSGTRMYCMTPSLKSLQFAHDGSPIRTYMSFIMDGVHELRNFHKSHVELSLLEYYPDPVLLPFSDVKIVTEKHREIEIQGQYLNSFYSVEDIHVMISGNESCNITGFTKHSLRCTVFIDSTREDVLGMNQSIEVRMGAKYFNPGYISIMPDEEINTSSSSSSSHSFELGATWTALIVLIAVAVVGVCCGVFWYQKKKRDPPRILVQYSARRSACEEEEERRPGNTNAYEAARLLPPEQYCDEETKRLFGASNQLISLDQLTLIQEIANGFFGRVWKGELLNEETQTKEEVAVKMVLDRNNARNVENFVREALLMRLFKHTNILQLMGVCFEPSEYGPLAVFPFMHNKDLKSYFISRITESMFISELLGMAVDIASGMEYLATSKNVHRDLAARNCMVDKDGVVKVGDFGISRDVYESDYYKAGKSKAYLPIKWMPPEAIEQGHYSEKSDVWSYGVVLWEIMTRCDLNLFPAISNHELASFLKKGTRLEQPNYCPIYIYKVMLKCWDLDPSRRPTFTDLKEIVSRLHQLHCEKEAAAGAQDDAAVPAPVYCNLQKHEGEEGSPGKASGSRSGPTIENGQEC